MRLALPLWFLLSIPSLGRPNTRAEASKLLTAFSAGQVTVNQLVNRLNFLGEQAWAAGELAQQWKRGGSRQSLPALVAVSQLAVVGDEDVERVLLSALKADDPPTRVPAIRGLGKMKSGRAVAPLSGLLGVGNAVVRREAAKALGDIGQPKAGPALAAAVKTEEELETKVTMLVALGRSRDRKQVAVLAPFLTQSSETTRLAAAQSLCLLGSSHGFDYARVMLASKERGERLQGLMVLDGSKGKAGEALLKGALADTDHPVRATAARILYEAGDRSKLTWLVLESRNAVGENRLPYEDQLERLHLSGDERQAILERAGVE